MELESMDCVFSSDGMDDEEFSTHIHHPFAKAHLDAPAGAAGGGRGGCAAPAVATTVHDLLECPVCTNSMFPPIHQDVS